MELESDPLVKPVEAMFQMELREHRILIVFKPTKFQPCTPRKWRSLLSQATNLDGAMQTIRLGGAVADELKQFRWGQFGWFAVAVFVIVLLVMSVHLPENS